jgi:exopolyphosphatase/guanosine-5'-triphosphate,3'-diphosphate pyrophosphatase
MRTYAAVDIGSNSVRLSIGRFLRGRIKVVHLDREVTRLGEGVFRNGSLDPAAMALTIDVLKRFRRATNKFNSDRVRVVATSASRDAKNSHVFIDWVRSSTGWKPEVISGLEEGRLIHLGIISNTNLSGKRALMIDLGGGSCELTLSRGQHIEEIISLPLGAVRLTQDFLRHDPPKDTELRKLRDFVSEELSRIAKKYTSFKHDSVITTSGSAAAITAAASRGRGNTATAAQVRTLAERLQSMSVEERQALKGINAKRAEIIVAGSEVFAQIMSTLRLRSMRYLPLGLRDGLLAQMAAEDNAASQSRRHLQVEREDALMNLARRYHVDLTNSQHVRALATQLFDALKTVHELPSDYSEWLAAAALLQEIGAYVSQRGRHRHAFYLISHSEIFGFTPLQRNVIAAIARYQGKSKPGPADRELKLLPIQEQERIAKAVMILRIARALNQGRNMAVRNVKARMMGEKVRLTLGGRKRTDLEVWAVEREVPYFREVFGRELFVSE